MTVAKLWKEYFQQNIAIIHGNHIKFEVSLHFWWIGPTVRHTAFTCHCLGHQFRARLVHLAPAQFLQ